MYIPELDRSFHSPPSFRVFAAQNPVGQGGGRKGLPKSFLNRFSKVYVEALSREDLLMIASTLFPDLAKVSIEDIPSFQQWWSSHPSSAPTDQGSGLPEAEERQRLPESFRRRPVLEAMIDFNSVIAADTGCEGVWSTPLHPWQQPEGSGMDAVQQLKFGRSGSPWEFNLRDVFRWAEATLYLAR